jgi:hypothetical protein
MSCFFTPPKSLAAQGFGVIVSGLGKKPTNASSNFLTVFGLILER